MNQIKYLVYALLLLVLFSFVTFNLQKFYLKDITPQEPTAIHYSSPTPAIEVNTKGKFIFQANCQTCHTLYKVMTGPALHGVETRGPWTNRKNLLLWVKNPAATINKFAYTKNLLKEYNGQIMPSFANLADKDIEAIFDYIANTAAGSMPIALQ